MGEFRLAYLYALSIYTLPPIPHEAPTMIPPLDKTEDFLWGVASSTTEVDGAAGLGSAKKDGCGCGLFHIVWLLKLILGILGTSGDLPGYHCASLGSS